MLNYEQLSSRDARCAAHYVGIYRRPISGRPKLRFQNERHPQAGVKRGTARPHISCSAMPDTGLWWDDRMMLPGMIDEI